MQAVYSETGTDPWAAYHRTVVQPAVTRETIIQPAAVAWSNRPRDSTTDTTAITGRFAGEANPPGKANQGTGSTAPTRPLDPAQTNERRLNFTNAWVVAEQARIAEQARLPAFRTEFLELMARQRQAEAALAREGAGCQPHLLDTLQENLPTLDTAALAVQQRDQFYNPAAVQAAACVAQSVFFVPTLGPGTLPSNERIRHYFTNLTQIGEASAYGYAMVGDLRDDKEAYVFKVSRDPTDKGLLHEAMVGLQGTNQLRQEVPNFAYIMGAFEGSPPIIDGNSKQVVTYCLKPSNDPAAVTYVMYENIKPAVSLGKLIRTVTARQFLMLYLQIVYATIAAQRIGFTHYDLHAGNVMVLAPKGAPPDSVFAIAYTTETGRTEYLITDTGVAVEIDYGFSHIERPQSGGPPLHLGGDQYQVANGVYPDRANPFFDLYKLLLSLLEQAQAAGNHAVTEEGRKLVRYFNVTDSLEAILSAQRSLYYALPLSLEVSELKLGQYAAFIRRVCDCSFLQRSLLAPHGGQYDLLDCTSFCLTSSALYHALAVSDQVTRVPHNVIELYDTVDHYRNEGDTEHVKFLLARFREVYPTAMADHLDMLQGYIATVRALLAQVATVITVTPAQSGQAYPLELNFTNPVIQVVMYNPDVVNKVRAMYLLATALVDATMNIYLYGRIGRAVAQTYGDDAVGLARSAAGYSSSRTVPRASGAISSDEHIEQLRVDFERNLRPPMELFKQLLHGNDDYLLAHPLTAAQRQIAPWYDDGPRAYRAAVRSVNVFSPARDSIQLAE